MPDSCDLLRKASRLFRPRLHLIGVAILGWLFACGPATRTSALEIDTLQSDAMGVLRKHCSKCHDGQNPNRDSGAYSGDFTFLLDVAQLVKSRKVVPGILGESELYDRLLDGSMPPAGSEPAGKPTAAEIKLVASWIQQLGVSNAKRERISLLQEYRAIADYLRSRDHVDRQYVRFFSLRVSHNNLAISEKDLELQRLALAKAINSLSWKKRLVPLKAVDTARTLFAMDLRDATWNSESWRMILRRYPYALRHDTSPPDEALNTLAAELYKDMDTVVPVLRIDWFVTHATRPPLYHDLLGIPETEAALEEKIGVEAARNILEGSVVRAGSQESGVSRQNRLLERHEGKYGFYWKSYDFLPVVDSPKSDLINLPLGPQFAGNPYSDFAFVHDGGELIFELPNGLQGYMLVNGHGQRIDAGPQPVVEDAEGRFSGSSIILNGISCIGCHADGMRNAKPDDIREGSVVRGRPLQHLRKIYPGDDVVAGLITEDRDAFRQSVINALKGMASSSSGLELQSDGGAVIEPITKVAKPFIDGPLNLSDVASDLDVESAERLAGAIQANAELRQLGLAPVASGQVIRRSLWESTPGLTSRFQRAAAALDVGTAAPTGN